MKSKRLGSTFGLNCPLYLSLPAFFFLVECGLFLLVLAKPLSDRTGFFLMFIQHIGHIPSGFCHGEGAILRIISGLDSGNSGPVHVRSQSQPCVKQFSCIKFRCLRLQFPVLLQGRFQFHRILAFLLVQLFQRSFHGGNIFLHIAHSYIVCAIKRV